MHPKVKLIQVTSWVYREQALRIANNTREFQPVFARKHYEGRTLFAVCRKPANGEDIPEGFELIIDQKETFKTI